MDDDQSSSQPKVAMKISMKLVEKKTVKLVEPVKLQKANVEGGWRNWWENNTYSDEDEEEEMARMEREKEEARQRKLAYFESGQARYVNEGGNQHDHSSIDPGDIKTKNKSVIPVPKEHDWRVDKLKELEKKGELSEEDKAKLALLTEEQPFAAQAEAIEVTDEAKQNTRENIEDADYNVVGIYQSSLNPYLQIPVEDFGLAILRGCGWKDGEGIGKNPQLVPIRIFERRPKGLGLGAKPKVEATNGEVRMI